MSGAKDHAEVSTSNIIKPTLEELSDDDQQRFEDIMKQDEEEVLRQINKRHEKAKEKYMSHFTRDSQQKIVQHEETETSSLLAPLQPLLGVCFVTEGSIRRNTFGRLTQSRSCQSESFGVYFQMHQLKDKMTNRTMIACIMIIIICKGHECNFSQAASCAYK
jgi:succinate dehydrogenase flavin-adding protein (antitoxin of CptAB toxin-antitoxin module)